MNKVGRPIGSKSRKPLRDVILRVYLTEDEFQDLENVSSARGMTATKYMRTRFMNAVARDLSKGYDFYSRP